MSIRIAAVVLSLVALLAACQSEDPESRAPAAESKMAIAFIDSNAVYRESKPGIEGMDMLGVKSEALRAKLDALSAKVDEARAGEDEEAAAAAEQAFQEVLNSSQAEMRAEQERVVNLLGEHYEKVLAQYRQEHGIQAVLPLESALSIDDALNITDEVIAALNTVEIDLTAPAAPAETPAEPENGEK